MTTTWLIQDTKRPTPTVRRLIRACAEHGRPVELISVTNGSTALPEIPAEPPFVFYGYSTLLVNAHSDIRFRPGVFLTRTCSVLVSIRRDGATCCSTGTNSRRYRN